ncbi:MAG: hypothetical protein Q8807_03405, partial ['Waltheria sp.' little leaf phytoplasma]|nr:hypothetical protein ['Waltheria sp.' little leaf phytoplasma]
MVEKLLAELPEKVGMEPNLVSYNIVINSFCEMGSLDSALSVVDTLESKGIEPDLTTINTLLLDALFMKGRIADGEKIWGLRAEKNVVPNIRSYNSKLRGLVNAHKLSEALELWEEMGSKGIKPDAYSYNALIKGYCDAENLEQAKKWFSELKKSGLSPDWFTYVILVHLYCKKYEFEKAIELCKEVINRRVMTGAAMFRTVIDALVKESRVEEAIQLVEFANPHFRYKLKLPST